jgi:hypothetical protein
MGNRIRLWEPAQVFACVARTVDRQFLFKPNHQPDNPLLRWDSDPRSLDPDNKFIPKPSIINIIGSSLVRAQRNQPTQLMWAEGNINHVHSGLIAPTDDDIGRISNFKRDANSLIARFTNTTHERCGHVLGEPFRVDPCLDDPSAEQQLLYAVTNVVEDGMVAKVSHSPFFSTYRHFAHGEPLEFWWIEWKKYYEAGGERSSKLHPKDFLRWGQLELTCLPEWEAMTVPQRQARFRHSVREIEEQCDDARRAEKRPVVGVPALYALDPRDRPRNPKDSGPQPFCHAADPETRRAFRQKRRAFEQQHYKASREFRDSFLDDPALRTPCDPSTGLQQSSARDPRTIPFPHGSFRPPITTIYNASRL